jgi:receptor protein-tyrosine kinase
VDIATYLAIWRRRWLLIIGAVLLGLAGAVAVSALTQPLYVASARMFVSTTGGTSVVETYQGNLFGQERVLSYAKLAAGRQVAQRTIDALNIDMTADQLMPMIKAERVPTETVLLDISVANPNPEMAQVLTNTVALQTRQLVEEVETSPRGGTPAATVVLVDAATIPTHPAVPNWFRSMLVGGLGGLVIGLVAAIVRDKFDSSVRAPAEAAAAVGARDLGSVPPLPKGRNGLVGIPFGPSRPESSEGFRSIRTNVLGANKGNAPNVILVAEPADGSEVGPVSLGLGAAFAESGQSVLAVDGDLRNQALSKQLGSESLPGLSNILDGSASVDETLVESAVERLKIMPAGNSLEEPGKLLAGQDIRQLIKQLRNEFDVVVICGGPALQHSDTSVIAGSADGVVLVARIGSTSTSDLASVADGLRVDGMSVLGVVVTNQKRRRSRRGAG